MLSFFQLDVLGENWDLIVSVSEEFLTYSFFKTTLALDSLVVYEDTCYQVRVKASNQAMD